MRIQSDRRKLMELTATVVAGAALAGCLNGNGDDEDTDGTDTEAGNGDGGVEETVGKSELPPEQDIDPAGDVTDTDAVRRLVAGNTAFASDVYAELADDADGDNLLVSPYSISVALGMTYAGARGDTADALRDSMRYTVEGDGLHAAFGDLRNEFALRNEVEDDRPSPPEEDGEDDDGDHFTLRTANAIWGQEGFPFLDDYLGTLEQSYGAAMNEVDFAGDHEEARDKINGWVADETEDRIEDLLPEGSLDALTRLVLTNAVYLNANWYHDFPKDATTEAEFELLGGGTKDVQMMSQQERFPYAEVDGHQAVEMPYAGSEVSMVVILPDEGTGFEEFEASLDAPRLVEFVNALEPAEGSLSLPRFGFESGFALRDVLSNLGAEVAFDDSDADFGDIADLDEGNQNLYLHDVYHDTFIEVDERGTEAAAATGVVIGFEGAPVETFEMTVDRPFVFFIRDRRTGSVLFFGRVAEPEDPHDG